MVRAFALDDGQWLSTNVLIGLRNPDYSQVDIFTRIYTVLWITGENTLLSIG